MKSRIVLTTCALLLAAVFRLWQIAEIPPGLHSDEAFHLLNAQMIARGENFPVYITGNNGNEPLFAYLSAITLLILGPVTWAGRLTAAWVGLIGVAATIRLGDEMFPRQGVGWLAGAALAALFWNIDFSRFGSQPILAATAAAATMAALWRGARSGSRWAFWLAGVSLGLGLDSYVSFRLFGFVALAAGLALLLAQPARRRELLTGGVVAALGTLVVYSPLALFFIQNPQWFFQRFNEVTSNTLGAGGAGLRVMLDNGVKTLDSLAYHGDENWRQNLPGRPALDVAQAFFGELGVAVLAVRWRRPEAPTLLVWLVVGLMPSVLTMEAPHFGRTTMVTPALALLVGLGLSSAWGWARRSRPWRALIVASALLSVAVTAGAYFGAWAHAGALFVVFDAEQVGLGRALQAAPAGARLLMPDPPEAPYTVEYIAGPAAFQRVETFNSANCLVLPAPANQPATFAVVNPKGSTLLPRLQQAYPAATWTVNTVLDNQPYIGAFQISGGQPPGAPVAVARTADFGGVVRLLGYSLTPNSPRRGDALKLHLVWQIEQPTHTAYKNFVHLLGLPKADGSTVYVQYDRQPCDDSYATTGWTAGDLLAADTTLDLPGDLPPGTYILQTGWYDSVTGARAPVTADAGPHANDAAQLQQVVVAQP